MEQTRLGSSSRKCAHTLYHNGCFECTKDMITSLVESQEIDWKKRDTAKLLIDHLNQHIVRVFHPSE